MPSAGQGWQVGLSTAWLEWLVLVAGRELMLFASVGILLIGLDDLFLDALWLATRGHRRNEATDAPPIEGCIAIFLPAWDEAAALPATLRRILAAWEGEDFRLYVGCYPNDSATIFAISPLVARDVRLRLVISEKEGPTTKGDNLNQLWAALCADERAEAARFAAVVLHDAEDHVHRHELALYRQHLADNAMVQIPVMPIVNRRARWVGGHYADEFAEAHGKDLVVRSRLGLPLPSAGVGCALTRNALALLAIERGGQPFRDDSLTEDYEMGMVIGAYGLGALFVDAVDRAGQRIVSRGAFPGRADAAVRQKSRWIAGIALAGWDHLGWPGSRLRDAQRSAGRDLLARWMLWRDRRAPLAALILLAAYVSLFLVAAGLAGQFALGWEAIAPGVTLQWLLALNLLLLGWRMTLRVHFTARHHGWREGMFAVPRAFVANIIAMLAARRAVLLYWRILQSGEVIWDKTDHSEADDAVAEAPVRAPVR